MKEILDNIYFSQSALNTFKICPWKFKMKYLTGIFPGDFTFVDNNTKEKKLEQGRLFHIIAERYFSKLPTGIENSAESDSLSQWARTLMEGFPLKDYKEYYPEYEVHLSGKIKLQAKYDLIVKNENHQFLIYDWKTETKPLRLEQYKNSLQTVLYCFLLVEAGEGIFGKKIKPNNVKMIYWQPSNPNKPLVLEYNEEQYLKDKWLLENLINKIMAYDFTKKQAVDMNMGNCRNCDLRWVCNNK